MNDGFTGDSGDVMRLCEWGRVAVPDMTGAERAALAEASDGWRRANRLNALPLTFEGVDGKTLAARQWVGVVQAAGRTVEIYPKLDKAVLGNDRITNEQSTRTVLNGLLWMLHMSGHDGLVDTDSAPLADEPASFLDLWALLLARNLLPELRRGVARRYIGHEDNLHTVRGRIQVGVQVGRNWNRMDKVACAWDEFAPDTPVNRLLRRACRFLHTRVTHRDAYRLLGDCVTLLDDVSDVSVMEALAQTEYANALWDRASERFRCPFALARRLLLGHGHVLNSGRSDTFVFLLDMNCVFEDYAQAALSARFGVPVEAQKEVGRLFPALSAGYIKQAADFFWKTSEGVWIGDAKYKHLTQNQNDALTFARIAAATDREADAGSVSALSTLAGRVLSPDDVRQLTVYAELYKRKNGGDAPHLALVYPFVGAGDFKADTEKAWNGSSFSLMPLRVTRPLSGEIADALPKNALELSAAR